MAWTTGARNTFPALPPADALPESLGEEIARFDDFSTQARDFARKALDLRQKRDRVRADYEAKIGQALVEGSKRLPPDPMVDYDQSIQSLESRAAGALRAAAAIYAQLGDAMVAEKSALVVSSRQRLEARLTDATSALDGLRGLVDSLGDEIALHRWLEAIGPQARHFAVASQERSAIDNGLGQIASALRRVDHELAQQTRDLEAASQ